MSEINSANAIKEISTEKMNATQDGCILVLAPCANNTHIARVHLKRPH